MHVEPILPVVPPPKRSLPLCRRAHSVVDGSRRLAVSSNGPLSFPSPTSTWQCLTLATPIASQLRRRRKSGRRLATSGAWRRCRRRRRAGPRQNGEPRRKKHGYDDERRKLMRSRTPTIRMHVPTATAGDTFYSGVK